MSRASVDRHRIAAAAASIAAPDVVIACSQRGRRIVVTAGSASQDATRRATVRYEIGSATKTFTGLLLAHLAQRHAIKLGDPVTRYLPPRTWPARCATISLLHLITHTSGLPRLPRDLYGHALPRWLTNPYAGYPTDKLVRAFSTTGFRGRPGTLWRYSNFGVALLGPALTGVTTTAFESLLADQILAPLGMTDTALAAQDTTQDATGHGYRVSRPVPPFDAAAFAAAGAVRATPGDLLTYLEAHLTPERVPVLAPALRMAQEPAIRRGFHHQHSHTLTWFRHAYDDGPILFHSGATPGHEAFLGFRPATQTAVVALSTRRYRPGSNLQQKAYELLI